MDQRRKPLVVAFAVVCAGGLFASVIYPRWIKPLVTIKEAIVELEEARDELVEDQAKVERAVRAFRGYVNRAGSFDIRRVENEIRARLNDMLAEHKLESVSVTPNTPKTEKKTGLQKMTMTVKAEGTLESAIKLMRDMAELPHLARVQSTSIQPITSRKKKRGKDKAEFVAIAIPLQIMALPQQKLAGLIPRDKIEQPDTFTRHENRDYSTIWTRTPFTPYIVYPPLAVKLKEADITVQESKRCNLEAVATGGDGDYEFVWTPSDGIDKPTARRVRVDTKSTGKRSYTVSVTDGQGENARATANLEIKPKPVHVARRPGPPPPPPPPPSTGPQRWKNGRDLQLCMALLRRTGSRRESEIMVVDQRSSQTSYYRIGDEFDAGTLVFIHPTGALVRREVDKQDQYFVYPIGSVLTEDMPCESAEGFPKLQVSAEWFKARDAEKRAAKAKADAPVPGDADDAATPQEREAIRNDNASMGPAAPEASKTLSDAVPVSGKSANPAGPATGTQPVTKPPSHASALQKAQPGPGERVHDTGALTPASKRREPAKPQTASPGKPGSPENPVQGGARTKPVPAPGGGGDGAKPARKGVTREAVPKATRSPRRRTRGVNPRRRGVRARPKQKRGKTTKSSTKD